MHFVDNAELCLAVILHDTKRLASHSIPPL